MRLVEPKTRNPEHRTRQIERQLQRKRLMPRLLDRWMRAWPSTMRTWQNVVPPKRVRDGSPELDRRNGNKPFGVENDGLDPPQLVAKELSCLTIIPRIRMQYPS
jgi:hypothetical protein